MKSMILGTMVCALVSSATFGAEAPKQVDAKAQLKYAASVKKGVKGLKGEERRAKLKEAAEAYSSVARYFPEALAEASEAQFRVGEIRRTIQDREGALAAFEKAVEWKGNRKFSAKASLEVGHLHRKAKKFPDAIAAYLKTAREFADQADPRDESLLWVGKIKLSLKEADAARELWKEVTENGADPLDQIRAWDLIAGSFLAENKPAEAAAVVARCQQALAAASEEPTNRGARVRKALTRMKSAKKLDPQLAETDAEGDEEEEREG